MNDEQRARWRLLEELRPALERLAADTRRDALREAAQACRNLGPQFHDKAMHAGADACASAIERMIVPESREG